MTSYSLPSDFIHVLFVDDKLNNAALTRDLGALNERGTKFSTSETFDQYAPGNRYGITNLPEAFMIVLAHELTHTLFEKVNVGDWDASEHLSGLPETYEAELMYEVSTKKNRELGTVTINKIVQQEIRVKNNQGIV